MKDAEDEAFDELAKRQGHWGGGYQAKRQMAADKLQEPVREALKLALVALEESQTDNDTMEFWDRKSKAITAIKAALAQPAQDGKCKLCVDGCIACDARAQPAQKPVAIRLSNGMIDVLGGALVPIGTLLYLTPPQREWVGLTDADIADCMEMSIQKTCRAVEAKLKEKNS